MKENVFVGVSGGVDSSVALLRVLKAGHKATAVFIKTWQPDFITCNWEKERLDAMRVAAHLEVPFITFDGENAYKDEVADYMIREYTLGRTPNPDVMKFKLPVAEKHDSQGICLLGPVDIKDFLSHYVDGAPGDVLNEEGSVIGTHTGALYYTLGQRHGFSILPSQDSSLPYYVVGKDMVTNTLTVSVTPRTCTNTRITLSDMNVIAPVLPEICEAQFRYRQKPFNVTVEMTVDGRGMLTVQDAHVDMPSVGQSCVLYAGRECLGGGIINDIV